MTGTGEFKRRLADMTPAAWQTAMAATSEMREILRRYQAALGEKPGRAYILAHVVAQPQWRESDPPLRRELLSRLTEDPWFRGLSDSQLVKFENLGAALVRGEPGGVN